MNTVSVVVQLEKLVDEIKALRWEIERVGDLIEAATVEPEKRERRR